jgi:hypothetical protein
LIDGSNAIVHQAMAGIFPGEQDLRNVNNNPFPMGLDRHEIQLDRVLSNSIRLMHGAQKSLRNIPV